VHNTQKQSHISIYIAVAILLSLTDFGPVLDLEIANAVYLGQMPSENMFGIIFSYIGIKPKFVGRSFLEANIFYFSKNSIGDTRKIRWLIWAGYKGQSKDRTYKKGRGISTILRPFSVGTYTACFVNAEQAPWKRCCRFFIRY
jgi:hypothetical protein